MSWPLAALVVLVAGFAGAMVGRWIGRRRAAHPTTQVAGYRIEAILGSGSTSTVYLGRDGQGQPVAVKVIYRLAGEDAQAARDRVDSEVAVLRTVSSENLPAVLAVADDPAGVAVVTEFVDGATLTAVLARNGRLSGPAAAAVLEGALLGLADLHATGLVHRDVKPDNIVVTPQGRSRLVDFGLAMAAGMPAEGDVQGSPAYMSPEQQAGSGVDARSDVWSCGAVLFEALHGQRIRASLPDQHEDADAVARRLLDADGIPDPLGDLTARALAADPLGRPSDAAELLAELLERAGRSYGPDWRLGAGLGALAAGAGARVLSELRAGTNAPAAAAGTSSGAGFGLPVAGAAVAVLLAAAVTVPMAASAGAKPNPVSEALGPAQTAGAGATPSAASPTTTQSSSPSPSASSRPAPLNLAALMAPNIVSGGFGGQAPVTLASLQKSSTAALFLPAQLAKDGMVAGVERFAGRIGGPSTEVFLLQLGSPAQAQDWLTAARSEAGPGFATSVPGGAGIVLTGYDWVRFVRGPVVAIVGATGSGARSLAQRLAGSQYNVLVAHVPPG